MKKFLLSLTFISVVTLGVTNLFPQNAFARPDVDCEGLTGANLEACQEANTDKQSSSGQPSSANDNSFGSYRELLPGIPNWDYGLTDDWSENKISSQISTIITNISSAISGFAGYLLIGFVIYGGYLYMFSSGDPTKAASGKKTIIRSFIGLAVVVFAKIIFSSISVALTGAASTDSITRTNSALNVFNNLVNWFIGIAGAVSAIYVVIGGIGYITSDGDPNKLQKAKTTIAYSLIGLAIVALSLVVSNAGWDIIEKANSGDDITGPITSLLNSIVGMLSIVAVIFIVKGGFTYMTSTGDAAKTKKAKETILYACIGLAVCAFSFVIVNWAIGAISGDETNPSNDSSLTTPAKKPLAFLEKKL